MPSVCSTCCPLAPASSVYDLLTPAVVRVEWLMIAIVLLLGASKGASHVAQGKAWAHRQLCIDRTVSTTGLLAKCTHLARRA